MGNSLGSKKTTKIMKINGETFKLKAPVKAIEVMKDYPNHVLLESESIKYYGTRAKPLQAHENLEPKRLYFLVDDIPREKIIIPRRVRSGINMSAKDRLEGLMLARRSSSDLSLMKPPLTPSPVDSNRGAMRVKMRLPRAEVERLMKESKDDEEVAQKIRDIYYKKNSNIGGTSECIIYDRGEQKEACCSDRDSCGSRESFKEARQVYIKF
ncbi:hypothetical protein ACFE04_029654 [Oxalis oulophora]